MTAFWRWLMSWLVWLSADPAALDAERPRASASVAAAYATFATDPRHDPRPVKAVGPITSDHR